MNGGGESNHVFSWEIDDVLSYLNLNDNQIGSGTTFEGDMMTDPIRFDTYQPLTVVNEVVESSTNVAKKRSPPNLKKNGKGIGEPKSSVDGVRDKGSLEHEIHIWTERKRTKKIGILFETLRALIPNIFAKVKQKFFSGNTFFFII